MIAYLDASVILRIVLQEPNGLQAWDELTDGVTSTITRVECFRSLSRHLVPKRITAEEHLRCAVEVDAILWRLRTISVTRRVITLASEPWTFPVGALDAIHLASAIVFRKFQSAEERPVLFATHDVELSDAAEAMHFDVIGVPL